MELVDGNISVAIGGRLFSIVQFRPCITGRKIVSRSKEVKLGLHSMGGNSVGHDISGTTWIVGNHSTKRAMSMDGSLLRISWLIFFVFPSRAA